MAVVLIAVLGLSACATSTPPSPDPRQEANVTVSVKAARAAIATGKHAMRPMTAQEIMFEWGTRASAKKALSRTPLHSTALSSGDAPVYQSLQEIVDSEICARCESRPYHTMVLEASRRHRVPPALIHAVIQKESGYQAKATSRRKARGLMQIMPETGRLVGVSNGLHLYDPRTNINAGTAYLKYLMTQHDTVDEVLAAYNAGSGNVRKYHGIPPFRETRRYVIDVKRYFAASSEQKKIE